MGRFGIRGQYEVGLSIDGYSLTPHPNLVTELISRSHIHMDLPSLTLKINDRGGEFLSKEVAKDNAIINLELSPATGSEFGGEFLLLGGPQILSNEGGFQLETHAVLNKPMWMRKVIDKHFPKMRSSEVLEQVASMAGLGAVVDATQDVMTWLPNNTPLSAYARFVAARGYAGDETGMLTGVNELGEFLYRDLSKMISKGAQKSFGFRQGAIPFRQWQVSDKTPVYNAARGYGSTTAFTDPTGALQELNEIKTTLLSNALRMGSVIKDAVGKLGVRIEGAPLDAGNTHEKYQQAIHQNKRMKSLFGLDIKVLCDQATDVNLYDIVDFEPLNPANGEPIAMYSGKYMVTGKTRIIRDGRYYEAVVITGQ